MAPSYLSTMCQPVTDKCNNNNASRAVHHRRPSLGFLNICSIGKKLDDLLDVRRDLQSTSSALLRRGTTTTALRSADFVLQVTKSSTALDHGRLLLQTP